MIKTIGKILLFFGNTFAGIGALFLIIGKHLSNYKRTNSLLNKE